ncbi:MAG TPA: immunoglobulin domain-containing protein [Candidatus Acidoferrum sp.]|nr:immunoglobulin domain-containing protein [Candidatus Acidoferrum sp.]
MKPDYTKPLALALALSTLPASSLRAQGDSVVAVVAAAQALPLVSAQSLPPFGTYWQAGNSLPCVGAPLPWPPTDPNAPVYAVGDQFLVDLTAGPLVGPLPAAYHNRTLSAADYAAIVQSQATELESFVAQLQAQQLSALAARDLALFGGDTNMPPLPPGGDGGPGDPGGFNYNTNRPGTNDLWLEFVSLSLSDATATLVVHPPAAEATTGVYDLFMSTNLSPTVPGLNLTNWTWLLRTDPGASNLSVLDLWADQAWFQLGRTNSTAGDGVSDAFKSLVLHVSPSTPVGPLIIGQPISQDVVAGDTVTFTVIAEGAAPLAYQWMFNGTNITGETSTSLTLGSVMPSQAGDYSVLVSSPAALSALSTNATLWVEPPMGDCLPIFSARQDFTFKAGFTYVIPWAVQFYGKTTIQGGSVIKVDTWQEAAIQIMGTLATDTSPYYPAILTCVDDDSAGEQWGYSDGWPIMSTNGMAYLDLSCCQDQRPSISNLRFSHAGQAVTTPLSAAALDAWDCQFVQCNVAVENGISNRFSTVRLHNSLLASCQTAVQVADGGAAVAGEQVTADVVNFWAGPTAPRLISLTNSIVVGTITPGPSLVTDHCAINPAAPVFQTNGVGHYYLASSSPYRTNGTAAITPRLLSEFRQKTTQPPLAFPAFMSLAGDMTLGPQAPRYTGGPPDYGFYYDALDYTVTWLTNWGSITVLPGTAIGFFDDYAIPPGTNQPTWTLWGFDLREGSSFVSHGTPTKPNTFTDLQFVQEQYVYPCTAFFVPDFWPNEEESPAPSLDFRFSNFYGTQYYHYHFWAGYDEAWSYMPSPDSLVNWTMRDCNLHGGRINLGPPDDGGWYSAPLDFVYGSGAVSWFNNLFDGVSITLNPTYYWDNSATNCDLAFEAYNNLFRDGMWFTLSPVPASAGNWVLKDNLFDKVDFVQDTNAPLDFNYNGYWPLAGSELEWAWYHWWKCNAEYYYGYPTRLPHTAELSATAAGGGGNEQVLTSAPPYQTGPLGNHYLPTTTPLYHAGSRAADAAGLFHYTTLVDQTKEGAGQMVNIGLHYVATAGPGTCQPHDYDGDGIPDYVENWHGDGNYNAHTNSETDWQHAWTLTGVFDTTNSLYDDVDLSGDGLVGRIKRALNLQPFDTSSPLTLFQVTTGQEPDIATFEVPISFDLLTRAGTLTLFVDGEGAAFATCVAATNGNCLLEWNTTYEPPGHHELAAYMTLSDVTSDQRVWRAIGQLAPFCSSNVLQFDEAFGQYDENGAVLYAKLLQTNANYTIELLDPSNSSSPHIRTITGSTSTGEIEVPWNLTYDNQTSVFTGDQVQAVFTVNLLDDPASGVSKQTLNSGTVQVPDGTFDVAFAWWDDNVTQPLDGAEWYNLQWAVVNTLMMDQGLWPVYGSTFNRPTWDLDPGYPGYLPDRAAVTDYLLPDLTNSWTRNFFFEGHGDPCQLSDMKRPPVAYMTVPDVRGALGNTFSVWQGVRLVHPYRLVFLDACRTAETLDWQHAFGIVNLRLQSPKDDRLARTGPQAFVGWKTVTPSVYATQWDAYGDTLEAFYAAWMMGRPLADCVKLASDPNATDPITGRPLSLPLPVVGNRNLWHRPCGKLWIGGYRGITENSYAPGY